MRTLWWISNDIESGRLLIIRVSVNKEKRGENTCSGMQCPPEILCTYDEKKEIFISRIFMSRVRTLFELTNHQPYHLITAGGLPYLDTQDIVTSWPSLNVKAPDRPVPPYSKRGCLGFTVIRRAYTLVRQKKFHFSTLNISLSKPGSFYYCLLVPSQYITVTKITNKKT